MVEVRTLTPFSTAARYADALQPWLGEYDGQRIAAYQVLEDVYWGQVGLVKASASNDDPIQVPVGRQIVEAVVRYLAVDWDLYLDPDYGTADERLSCERAFRRLFRREDFWAKFQAQKRWGLVKGDALWHVTADPNKPAGSRISLHTLPPETYFPTFDETGNRRTAVYIAEPVTVAGKVVVSRQAYRKTVSNDGTVTVTSELAYFEQDGWDDRDGGELKVLQVLRPAEVLEGVTQLPVYHVRNTVNPGDPYGSSLLRGLERVLRGVDQTITDEDLAVALAGLGFFATDSAGFTDAAGNDADPDVSPLNILFTGKNSKGEPATFKRVDGVGSVQPAQDHARYLEDAARRGASVPSIAVGAVDTTVAESGIARFLAMSPLLAANSEREDVMLGVYSQMLHDLQHDWFPTYEGLSFPDVLVDSVVGDPMPTNRAEKIAEVLTLATSTPPLITLQMAQDALAKLGYTFTPADGPDALLAQVQRQAQAVDPFSGRLTEEAGDNAAATA